MQGSYAPIRDPVSPLEASYARALPTSENALRTSLQPFSPPILQTLTLTHDLKTEPLKVSSGPRPTLETSQDDSSHQKANWLALDFGLSASRTK